MSPTSSVHETALKGFQVAASAYERGRPEYLPEAVNFLLKTLKISSGKTVVDLGAGTGKFTRLLAADGVKLIAVEPVEGMRRFFTSLLPGIEILAGTAESIPLAEASVDVVVAAQAFHWFQGESSLQEIHRVLKPDGYLGMIWNMRDKSVEWITQITKLIDSYQGSTPRYKSGQWQRAFNETALFTELKTQIFNHAYEFDREALVDRVASISFIAALPESTRHRVLNEVRDLLDHHPLTRGKEKISHPYRTDFFWCVKK